MSTTQNQSSNAMNFSPSLPGRLARRLALWAGACAAASTLQAQTPNIPSLNWTPRSDWVNVKTAVTPAAVGDGVADDTAALQAGLNQFNATSGGTKVLYLPPGTYRITTTLTWPGSVGCSIIGHGRDTKILWSGTAGADMLRTDGAARATYMGIVWDGGSLAMGATGIHHNAKSRFESSSRHQHEAFLNLNKGIAGDYGNGGTYATSEMLIDNCLFSNCNTGIKFSDSFNYYNETITRSEFRNCGLGVCWGAGYGYIRFCHFEGSTVADVQGATRCSVRYCTSNGSAAFYLGANSIPAVLQNNTVAACSGTAPVSAGDGSLIFDNQFLPQSGTSSPIRLVGSNSTALAIVSQNVNSGTAPVYAGLTGYQDVAPGQYDGLALPATRSFLQQSVTVPPQVFDVKSFNAVGNGSADDTAAIQACVNAAKAAGNGAIAYFPRGQYKVTSSINVTGSNYVIGGIGYYSELKWGGTTSGVVFNVVDPVNVRMENLSMQDYLIPAGSTAIRQTSQGAPSSITYDRLTLVQGPKAYSEPRLREGLQLVGLPSNATVHLGQIYGTVRITDSGEALIVGELMDTSGDLIDGANRGKTGFTGFLTRNGLNLLVNDNNDLVVGDANMEQSSAWNQPNVRGVWLSGGNRAGAGIVTVGAMKVNLFDTPNITEVNNYQGVFSFFHANIADGQYPFANTLQSGTRPVDMVYGVVRSPQKNSLLQMGDVGGSYCNVRDFHQNYIPVEWYGQGAQWVDSTQAQNPAGAHYGLALDGTNDFVNGSSSLMFSGSLAALTVQAWVKLDVLNRDCIVVAHQPVASPVNTTTNLYSLEIGTNNKARFMVRNNTTPYTPYYTPYSQTTLTAGTWYLLTGVWDGTNVNIYVNDGPSEGTVATPAFGNLRSGGQNWMSKVVIGGANGRFLQGSLDEVRFYNVAKAQTDIDAVYNGGAGVYGSSSDPGLFAGYHFDEGSGRNAFDYKGNFHAQLYQYNTDSNPPQTLSSLSQGLDHFRELGEWAYQINFPLGAPGNLVATAASPTEMDLAWQDNSDNETGFQIVRATDSTFSQNLTTVTTTASNVIAYHDSGLSPTTTYYYRVRAVEPNQVSSYSNTASATLPSALPAAPTNLAATAVSKSQIDLSWTDNSGNETGFKVERADDAAFTAGVTLVATTAADATSYSDVGLSASTTYYYRVRATNSAGDSANSQTASATTQAGVLTSYTLNPVADSYVRSGSYSALNYGTATSVFVKNDPTVPEGNHEIFMKFTLPANAGVLQSATLRLYVVGGSSTATHRAAIVSDDSWTETGITYSNKPASGAALASWTPYPSSAYKEIPLDTALVATELNGDQVISIRITNDTTGYHSYRSKEYAASKPELVLTTLK